MADVSGLFGGTEDDSSGLFGAPPPQNSAATGPQGSLLGHEQLVPRSLVCFLLTLCSFLFAPQVLRAQLLMARRQYHQRRCLRQRPIFLAALPLMTHSAVPSRLHSLLQISSAAPRSPLRISSAAAPRSLPRTLSAAAALSLPRTSSAAAFSLPRTLSAAMRQRLPPWLRRVRG